MASLPAGHELWVFAQQLEGSSLEEYDHFRPVHSAFDPVGKTVRAQLPAYVFVVTRRPDHTFEAIVLVGSPLK